MQRVAPEAAVEMSDNRQDQHRNERGTSLEKYLLMDEKEKDLEIQKAVTRLQKRIQEILYLLETDKPHSVGAETNKRE